MDEKAMNAVLIAGPTASGKSALALDLAKKLNGIIINADSMQVYDVLQVLTARPGPDEIFTVVHRLYGHVPAQQAYSVGAWSRDVVDLLKSGEFAEKTPIFVGGTGLYFKALLGGLAQMPAIPVAIREHWRGALQLEGPEKLHEVLAGKDPDVALRLNRTDGQRIARALEVFDATGQSIASLQGTTTEALIDVSSARKIVLLPERAKLWERIHKRFEAMLDRGAIDEVRMLLAAELSAELPVMKAIGVREITAMIKGDLSRGQAIERGSISTRQYAKRQSTWFRNQFDDDWERRV